MLKEKKKEEKKLNIFTLKLKCLKKVTHCGQHVRISQIFENVLNVVFIRDFKELYILNAI